MDKQQLAEILAKERPTDKAWMNFDPWECCGQDNYCKRGCHEEGGCTGGCIVPKIYKRLAKYEDTLPALARQCEALMEVVKTAEEVFKQIDLRTRTLGLDMSNYHAISIQIKPGEAGKDYWQAVWAYNKAMAALEALAEGGGE